jgi:formylglycine-generating enzyme required for sulfatase activity
MNKTTYCAFGLVILCLLLPSVDALADLQADTARLNRYLDQLRDERIERERHEQLERERQARLERERQERLERERLARFERERVERVVKRLVNDMVSVLGGCFQMGGNSGSDDEKPVHEVCLKGFQMGQTEVTQGQWRALMGSNPSHFSSCGDDCPVESVSWNDIQDFLKTLNRKTGSNFRLPSEAEWEYACRGGRANDTYCGGDDAGRVGWYSDNSGRRTHEVGGKSANAFGLYDMSGNVWEWTQDCWNSNYNGAPRDGSDWQGGDCSRRVLRGGSWNFNDDNLRAALRSGYFADFRNYFYGFRRVLQDSP